LVDYIIAIVSINSRVLYISPIVSVCPTKPEMRLTKLFEKDAMELLMIPPVSLDASNPA
jgi:hypothetical protein